MLVMGEVEGVSLKAEAFLCDIWLVFSEHGQETQQFWAQDHLLQSFRALLEWNQFPEMASVSQSFKGSTTDLKKAELDRMKSPSTLSLIHHAQSKRVTAYCIQRDTVAGNLEGAHSFQWWSGTLI